MFNIITVAREYGSGGAQIAQMLADRLGWKLLDRCLIETIAKRAHVDPSIVVELDEHPDPWLTQLTQAFTQYSTYLPGGQPDVLDTKALASVTRQVIEEAARIGNCVIVGRGSQCILQRRNNVFHTFIYAPRQERLNRLRQRHPTPEDAEAALEARDRERADHVRQIYGQDWTNPHLYHLMLCSSMGEEAAVSIILGAMDLSREKELTGNQGVPKR
ncbi:MAG: AAA family ATPase [Terriglobia bacterium]